MPFSYLVPDADLLPIESIRFFYVDRAWTDALVQGVLSVGTTLAWALADRDDDDPLLATLVTTGALVAPAVQLVIVLASGRTLGEHVVRLRPTPRPGVGRRLLRWALGSGGWATLLALDVPLFAFVASVLAIASVIAVWSTRGRRGLALAVLRVDVEDEMVVLSVSDEGPGLSVPLDGDGVRFGLKGLRDRIESVGGRMSVETAPGRGTCLTAHLPLNRGGADER